jgi:hypothetical protein
MKLIISFAIGLPLSYVVVGLTNPPLFMCFVIGMGCGAVATVIAELLVD